eukprot:7579295-Pyramimonas_sp.AAC.1
MTSDVLKQSETHACTCTAASSRRLTVSLSHCITVSLSLGHRGMALAVVEWLEKGLMYGSRMDPGGPKTV